MFYGIVCVIQVILWNNIRYSVKWLAPICLLCYIKYEKSKDDKGVPPDTTAIVSGKVWCRTTTRYRKVCDTLDYYTRFYLGIQEVVSTDFYLCNIA